MTTGDYSVSGNDIRQIKLVTWVGLVINLILSLLKFAVGILGTSQAVVADGVHSLSDMATDIAVIIGVRFWSLPPDQNHPFGHRRIETLVTAGIGMALALAAFSIGYRALFTIRDMDIRQPEWITLIGPAVSIVVKEALYRWNVSTGRRVRSPAVVANAWHHRTDAFSSVPVLIAVVLSRLDPRLAFIDHAGAFVVSLFIIKVAWDVGKPALLELSGLSASAQDRQRIEEIVRQVEGVRGLHALRTRRQGGDILVDLHVLVSGDMSIRRAHEISEQVKRELLDREGAVTDVLVHIEPCD